MKIYKLIHKTEEFKTIELEDARLLDIITNDFFNTKNLFIESLGEYNWSKGSKDLPSCDFPFLSGNIPIISEGAYSVLKKKLSDSEIDILPLMVNNLGFYLLNFKKTFSAILNLKGSKIQYFKNGEIMDIPKYVFNEKVININPIFMIEELKIFVFVNEDVKNLIESHNLTGLTFEECEIKN